MSEKIIFLDVDGVLNSFRFRDWLFANEGIDCFHEDILDPKAIGCVRKLIRETDAKIVISSSWRWDSQAMEHLTEQLNRQNIQIYDKTIDDIRVNMSRADEINLWLTEHPWIAHYVVLDDTDMNIPEIAKHHVKTTLSQGLVSHHVEQAKKILMEI